MGYEENIHPPGDENWWAYLGELADKMLEGSGCEKVHPTVADWVNETLNRPPNIDEPSLKEILENYFRLPGIDAKNILGAELEEQIQNVIEENMRLLLLGRSIRASNIDRGGFVIDHRGEVGQAMVCMATEAGLLSLKEAISPESLPFAELSERFYGPDKAAHFLGLMIVGWAFQDSLEAGEFDDM